MNGVFDKSERTARINNRLILKAISIVEMFEHIVLVFSRINATE